jgi:hypothetical protein
MDEKNDKMKEEGYDGNRGFHMDHIIHIQLRPLSTNISLEINMQDSQSPRKQSFSG